MSKKQKDTSWELPAGIRNTGLNNLTQALGIRSREIVERLNNDQSFTLAAGKALIALYDDKPTETPRSTMEKVKQIMGGRCFLPDEAQELLGLQHHDVASIPKLTGRQIEQLEAFLKTSCPIIGNVPAAETHILFPQPSTISGSTFGMGWVLENADRKWRIKLDGPAFNVPIPDRFYNQVRNSRWFLMFWDARDESAVPSGTDVEKLFEIGYDKPDLAVYTLALGYLKARGVDLNPRLFGGSATLLDGLSASRTVTGGLNVHPEDWDSRIPECALVRRVPLR